MTPRIELPRAWPIELAVGGRRRRNVLKGELMVTPVRSLELRQDGKTTELRPGPDRLSPDHWAVRERPELFRPCMKGDKLTANLMRDLLSRAERAEFRAIDRQRGGARTATRPRTYRLPGGPSREPPWKLP